MELAHEQFLFLSGTFAASPRKYVVWAEKASRDGWGRGGWLVN